MPAPDGGDDLVRIGDPLEWLGLRIMVVEEAIDRLIAAGRSTADRKTPRFKRRLVRTANKSSTALSY